MIPYVREIDIEYGRCDQVSPLIRRVTANNPGPFTFKGTGTYIVGRGEVAVIDPGPDDPAHLEAILAAVAGERVSHILITHDHNDHSPLAAPLKARTGAPIYGCKTAPHDDDDGGVKMEAGRDTTYRPDIDLCAGGVIEGAGWTMDAITTPGHTSNHICFGFREENACFSGDHIMGWSTTVITPPDGDMTDYLASLNDIRGRRFDVLWPTHGPPIRDADAFIAAYIDHRQERVDQILAALKSGPARINQLVPRLYADVDARLHPAAARSMLAAMIHLVRKGQLVADGSAGPESEYRLAG
ncbi:MAG: MBL fold metallo-hydrolase [Alphaproteobacteria bacterium]|nr:MBL fold metallo-hydrolase [Alphaproteobacteria bacterium]MBU1512748.1 MBL fold metallo-hydrolase [Alphaproteobacteria bacterium]MBU2096127.1 MBL fold metallo-hydrolase [Alphaproteobacteria bacterium]MBU2152841.1 MBL fold metallo-hydrolase [Alphaproteobacteria bacterium]MBU2307983.1 MBL fold metallo-hydrolase [Alphaproteobacteria bacterium]